MVSRIATVALLLAAGAVAPAAGGTVVLTPSRDNTLYESPTGELSNGAGEYLFAGSTLNGNRRRALLAFDVAGQLPAEATIESATLTLAGGASDVASVDDPQVARLLEEKAALTQEVNDLRRRKGDLDREAYERRLEDVLVRLALINRELRQRQGDG